MASKASKKSTAVGKVAKINPAKDVTSSAPSDLDAAVATIFNDAQKSKANHNRCLRSMENFVERYPGELFKCITPMINKVLVVLKRDPPVERVVEFIARFCAAGSSVDGENSLAAGNGKVDRNTFTCHLVRYLLSRADATDKAVRFRVCQLVSLYMEHLSEEAELDEDLCDEIATSMLERCHDKIPTVRAMAVNALGRLCNPDDVEDDVLCEMFRMMNTDSSRDARKAALCGIAISKITIEEMIKRTQDISDIVRKEAFVVFRRKIALTELSIKQRCLLIQTGLMDREAGVVQACSQLITESWLKCVSVDNNLIKLLEKLDVVAFPEACTLLLKHLFTQGVMKGTAVQQALLQDCMKSTPVPPFQRNALTPESALFWRVLCEVAASQNAVDYLDSLLPDTPMLCRLVATLADEQNENSDIEAIVKQMLLLCTFVDLQDEAGRAQLETLQRVLVGSLATSNEQVKLIIKGLRVSFGKDEAEFIRVGLEILSEISSPLNETGEQAEESESGETWERMLVVVASILENVMRSSIVNGLDSVLESTIMPALSLNDTHLKASAFQCLGLYCLLGENEAKKHAQTFVDALKSEDRAVVSSAMKSIIDLMLVYPQLFFGNDGFGTVVAIMESILDGSIDSAEIHEDDGKDLNRELRFFAVQSLAKLMILNRYRSSDTIAKFLLALFAPSASGLQDDDIKQCLSVFFPTYANIDNLSGTNLNVISVGLVKALMTVKTARKSSLFSKLNTTQLSKFVVDLLGQPRADKNPEASSSREQKTIDEDCLGWEKLVSVAPRTKLAFRLCFQQLADPSAAFGKAICYALSIVSLEPMQKIDHDRLYALAKHVAQETRDKQAMKLAAKFSEHVDEVAKLTTSAATSSADSIQSWEGAVEAAIQAAESIYEKADASVKVAGKSKAAASSRANAKSSNKMDSEKERYVPKSTRTRQTQQRSYKEDEEDEEEDEEEEDEEEEEEEEEDE